MKNSIAKTLGALVAALAIGAAAHAVPITGTYGFTGDVNLNTASAGTASAVSGWQSATVLNVSGAIDLYSNPGEAVTLVAPWSFNSGPIASFWQSGGWTFDLTSSVITSQGFTPGGDGFVTVAGTGVISGHAADGYEPTFATFNFSTQDPSTPGTGGPQFTFSASGAATARVPDGGTTIALLGAALAGLALARRKIV